MYSAQPIDSSISARKRIVAEMQMLTQKNARNECQPSRNLCLGDFADCGLGENSQSSSEEVGCGPVREHG